MQYPSFLKEQDLIGITALSSGCSDSVLEMNTAINNLQKYNFNVIATDNIYGNYIVSSDKETRINELNTLLNQDIKLLLIARGGDFMYELLDDIPYEKIVSKNILVQGYSDPTSLLYILTTKYDISTVYGLNGKSYGDLFLSNYQLNNLDILKGLPLMQVSYDNDSVSLNGNFDSRGILIGGCLEVLKNLIGTKFDETKSFLLKYRHHKIIWYFDIYNMNPIDVYITLLQFKNAGWFKYSDTFLIGKVMLKQDESVITYKEAYKRALFGNIVYNANIGHVKPMFTLINGSLASVIYHNNRLLIKQEMQDK